MLIALKNEVTKHYDIKPLIIVYDESQLDVVKNVLAPEKFRVFIGTSSDVLA
jgi:hypothetical protein